MTWTMQTSNGYESDKIAALCVPYLQGKTVLDIGCGMRKVWPSCIGVDNSHHFGNRTAASIHSHADDLSVFADESVDAIFSSHLLEHIPRENVPALFAEWSRVLKPDGHIVLYVPSANLYPKCGEYGANPDHKWDIYPGDIEKIFRTELHSDYIWTLRESEERAQLNEYSLFVVLEKTRLRCPEDDDTLDDCTWQRNPHGKKRALVIRYGAIGDMLQTALLLPALKGQGYHITVNCKPESYDIIKHDPYVDEWILQARDFVPNEQLQPYWLALSERYDRVINLCESVEGSLLALPGRTLAMYSNKVRDSLVGDINYLDYMQRIAEVDAHAHKAFYSTESERRKMYDLLKSHDKHRGRPVLVWAMCGSSAHKIYPHMGTVIQWLTEKTNAIIYCIGDATVAKALQDATILGRVSESARESIVPLCGELSIRESLTLASLADCVVGPETGILNAVAYDRAVAKVIYLSHSSAKNLTHDWINTTTIEGKSPCFPCHLMHYDMSACNVDSETGAAMCASRIEPRAVFADIRSALLSHCPTKLRTKG